MVICNNYRHHRSRNWNFRFDVSQALNQTKSGAAILPSCLRLPLPAPAEQIAYAFPSAASSRNRKNPTKLDPLHPPPLISRPAAFAHHYSIFNRIRSADRAAVEFNRDFPPLHSPNLIEAAPGVHPATARRIAANIAKLPELLRVRKTSDQKSEYRERGS